MPTSTTTFPTPNSGRYLAQLCKHFAHKVEVSQDDNAGVVTLPPGRAELQAEPDGLLIRAVGPDAESLNRAKQVIESHLLRFAFREEPQPLVWEDAA
ncbi:DUF2218 domain-containing protein [Rubellimicrobium arenae]|uniref:DUF2218 domain-containing protein n=1 Tax=Rubellimicrobium arenae TaxID=2817372 RepID=UPI001B304399|nr:DUF2218 domain-containing protein [Rubellimicrobium arenae]